MAEDRNLEIWGRIREEKLVVTEGGNQLESCGGDKKPRYEVQAQKRPSASELELEDRLQ